MGDSLRNKKTVMVAMCAAVAAASAVMLSADPAAAQAAVGAMPSGRFAGVATTTLGYICITLGVVCVALALVYGLFQMFWRSEGVGIVIKSLLVGSFLGLVLPLAVWTVGTTPTTATIPQPGASGGFGGL